MNLIPPPIDLDEIPLEANEEWIDGRPVEKPMGARASEVALALGQVVRNHIQPAKLGHVFGPDCGYQLPGLAKRRVRKPDMTFVARGRLPNDEAPDGDIKIAPDLAVEVISPNDLAEDVEARVDDLLQAGTRLVWLLYPASQTAYVIRADGTAARLTAAQELSGEAVVPGFSIPVATLFASL